MDDPASHSTRNSGSSRGSFSVNSGREPQKTQRCGDDCQHRTSGEGHVVTTDQGNHRVCTQRFEAARPRLRGGSENCQPSRSTNHGRRADQS